MGDEAGALIQARIEPALASPIQIVIGMRGDENAPVPFDLRRLRIGQGVAAEFRSAGRMHLEDLAASQVRAFAPGYVPDPGGPPEVLELARANFDYPPLIDAMLNPGILPPFTLAEAKNIAFHCFVVRQGDLRAGFLKKAGGILLARKGGISGFLVEDRIERLDTEVLTFSPTVDIVIEPDVFWISNVATYRSLFRKSQALLAAISVNVQAVAQVVPIANADQFEEACRRDPGMMAKLAEVSAKPYLDSITPQAIRAVIDGYHLPEDVLDADGRLVHANSPKRRWLILKILDDSYLQSTMTQVHYEVNSKLGV
jgi:hypothetical protein